MNRSLVARIFIKLLRTVSRYRGVIIRDMSGFCPMGMYWKYQMRKTPLSTSISTKSSDDPGIHILPGLGNRGAIKNSFLTQVIHGRHQPLKMALPPMLVSLLFKAFHADHGDHITQPAQPLGHLFINERSVGINLEDDITVSFVKIEQIGPNKWLTAREGDEVDCQFLCLSDDAIQNLITEAETLFILTRIAVVTLQITPHGWADHEEKRGPQAEFLLEEFPKGGLLRHGEDKKVLDDSKPVLRREVMEDLFNGFDGGMAFFDIPPQTLGDGSVILPSYKLFPQIDDL